MYLLNPLPVPSVFTPQYLLLGLNFSSDDTGSHQMHLPTKALFYLLHQPQNVPVC